MVLGRRLRRCDYGDWADPQTFTELVGGAGTVLFRCCLNLVQLLHHVSGYPRGYLVTPPRRASETARPCWATRSPTGRSNACRSSRPIRRQTAASAAGTRRTRLSCTMQKQAMRERGGGQPLAPRKKLDGHRLPLYIRKDGKVYRGRPNGGRAHAQGHNSRAIGICREGSSMTETMPQAQLDALKDLIRTMMAKYLGAKLLRHKDVNSTDCLARISRGQRCRSTTPKPRQRRRKPR